MTAVRAVVFDVGKVLVEWDPRHLYEKLIADRAECDAFMSHVVTPTWHFQHDAGRPFAETSAELIAQFPQHRALIEAWGPRFNETIPYLIPGMRALVGDLAARATPLYIISNFSGEFWPPFAAREAALFAPFQGFVISGEEKLIKPNPEIYRLARRRFGLGEGEAIFIDDKFDNVEAARAEGFVGHQFEGAGALRRVLEQIAVL